MDLDRNNSLAYVEAMEASTDQDKVRFFMTLQPSQRESYLSELRAVTRSDGISLKKRATLLNVQRKLERAHREAQAAGR
jgi:hypothetical protein